jgi:putative transcriptional regulator
MTAIKYHPAPENLLSCSAGSMPEALAAVMASHLDMCPQCRSELSVFDALGGALLQEIQPVALENPFTGQHKVLAEKSHSLAEAIGDVPRPLQHIVGHSLADIDWSRIGIGIWQHLLPLSQTGDASLRLIKVSPGQKLPDHGHSGAEMTLVLRGAFGDQLGFYRAGDVIELDEDAEHAPIADASLGCICLVATSGKLRFKGIAGRFVQKLTGL